MPKPPVAPKPNQDPPLDQTRTEAEALMAMLRGQSGVPSVEKATRRLPAPEEPPEGSQPETP